MFVSGSFVSNGMIQAQEIQISMAKRTFRYQEVPRLFKAPRSVSIRTLTALDGRHCSHCLGFSPASCSLKVLVIMAVVVRSMFMSSHVQILPQAGKNRAFTLGDALWSYLTANISSPHPSEPRDSRKRERHLIPFNGSNCFLGRSHGSWQIDSMTSQLAMGTFVSSFATTTSL